MGSQLWPPLPLRLSQPPGGSPAAAGRLPSPRSRWGSAVSDPGILTAWAAPARARRRTKAARPIVRRAPAPTGALWATSASRGLKTGESGRHGCATGLDQEQPCCRPLADESSHTFRMAPICLSAQSSTPAFIDKNIGCESMQFGLGALAQEEVGEVRAARCRNGWWRLPGQRQG